MAIGGAYAAYLASHGTRGAVVVSRDNRPSGAALRDALVDGLTTGGLDVIDIGVVPTPLNYWALHHLPVVGGIQITGSHNPPEYNGFKLSMGTASLHGDHIQDLYKLTQAPKPAAGAWARSEKKRSSTATSTISSRALARSRAAFASCTTAETEPERSSRRHCSRSSASKAAVCSARATEPFPTIIRIRPFRKTSSISSRP